MTRSIRLAVLALAAVAVLALAGIASAAYTTPSGPGTPPVLCTSRS